MEKFLIDINCDLGEEIGNESLLMPFISSCNIACGGHAGNKDIMYNVVGLAKEYGVKIGAHPSYPDRENFGRLSMDLSKEEFKTTIQNQIADLVSICELQNVKFHHIKPHGALYNDLAKDKGLALLFLETLENYKSSCFLYVPYASVIEKLAIDQNFKIKREAFGDRAYNPDLSLVSRKLPNAVIEKPVKVKEQLINIIQHNYVKTSSHENISLKADTFCIHGDTPSALQILMYLSNELPNHNIFLDK
jgi:UPF0271 protein